MGRGGRISGGSSHSVGSSFSGGKPSSSIGRGGHTSSPSPSVSHRSSPSPSFSRPSSAPRTVIINHHDDRRYDRYDRYDRPRYNSRPPRPRRPKTLREHIFELIMFIIVLLVVVGYMYLKEGGSFNFTSSNFDSTIQREKLDSSALVKSGNWIEDNAKWLSNKGKVEKSMQYFLDKTGIQPYLMINNEVNGSKTFSDSDVQKLMTSKYDSLFKDEAHMILLFLEPTPNDYSRYILCGTSASAVMDSEAQNIMYKYIDSYYVSDLSEEDYFATIFTKTADKMMQKVTTKNDVAKSRNMGIIIFIIVVGGIVFFVIKKKASIKEKELARDILNSDISKVKSEEDKELEEIENKYK